MLNEIFRKSKKELPALDKITVSKMDTTSIENIAGGNNQLFRENRETSVNTLTVITFIPCITQ